MNFGQVHDIMVKDIRNEAGLAPEGGPLYFVERERGDQSRPFGIREVDSDTLTADRFSNRRDAEKRAEALNREAGR